MSHYETTERVFARPAIDRAVLRDGLDGTEQQYGLVEIVHSVTIECVTDGARRNVLSSESTEKVLHVMDAVNVPDLMRTLGTAMHTSLRVTPPRGES